MTKLFLLLITTLMVRFNCTQNIVGVEGKIFAIQQQFCKNPLLKDVHIRHIAKQYSPKQTLKHFFAAK